MSKNALFVLGTAVVFTVQALFVDAGAIDFVIRQAWPLTAMAMVAIGTMFAFANRHELRVWRFIANLVVFTLVASQAIVLYAWASVGALPESLDSGYWMGVVMLTASLLPFVTIAASGITFFFWYDWGFDQLYLKPKKTCSRCSREIPHCVNDARFCPYCGQDQGVRHV